MDIFEQVKDTLEDHNVTYTRGAYETTLNFLNYRLIRGVDFASEKVVLELYTKDLKCMLRIFNENLSDEEIIYRNMQYGVNAVSHKDFLSALERLIE
jgi:hypothetical protein